MPERTEPILIPRPRLEPVFLYNVVWNSVKGGSTVPLNAVTGFTAKTAPCPGSTAVVDEIELVTTGGTSLRYDTTGGPFIRNWQDPKKPGACTQAIATLQDGSTITANFTLK